MGERADYEEAVRWAYSLAPRGIRLDLTRLRAVLKLVGSPERDLRVIHVAGTNGKGSVSAMIERGLRENGLRTGLYTSPHLHTFTERIRVDGEPITRGEATEGLRRIEELLAQRGVPELTFFEVATLLAFQTFRARAVDVVVLEVGLGGRLDATNVVKRPLLGVITRIAKDHQVFLGKTLPKIAFEKAGILKRGLVCLSGVEQPSAKEVIAARAREVGAEVVSLGEDLVSSGKGAMVVRLGEVATPAFRLPLAGAHQRRNAALAAGALLVLSKKLKLSMERSVRGIEKTVWPGRLELVGRVLFDAAHNPDGASALSRYLAARTLERGHEKRVLVFGAMRDKDWRAMLRSLGPHVDEMVFCAPELGRAEEPRVLAEGAAHEGHVTRVAPSIEAALEVAQRRAGKRGLVVVCGSIFVLAEARARLLGIEGDPPIAM